MRGWRGEGVREWGRHLCVCGKDTVWSSIPKTHEKGQTYWEEDPWGSLAGQSSLIGQLQDSGGPPKTRWKVPEKHRCSIATVTSDFGTQMVVHCTVFYFWCRLLTSISWDYSTEIKYCFLELVRWLKGKVTCHQAWPPESNPESTWWKKKSVSCRLCLTTICTCGINVHTYTLYIDVVLKCAAAFLFFTLKFETRPHIAHAGLELANIDETGLERLTLLPLPPSVHHHTQLCFILFNNYNSILPCELLEIV